MSQFGDGQIYMKMPAFKRMFSSESVWREPDTGETRIFEVGSEQWPEIE